MAELATLVDVAEIEEVFGVEDGLSDLHNCIYQKRKTYLILIRKSG